MPNTKSIQITGKSGIIYKCIIRQKSTGYLLDPADGTFKAAGSISGTNRSALSEDSDVLGLHILDESREIWTDMTAQVIIYEGDSADAVSGREYRVRGDQIITLDGSGIKKNIALSNFGFPMRDQWGSPATGLTVTAERSLDGAAFAACANAVSEIGNGLYVIDLAAADLNGGVVILKFTATGARQRELTIVTES